MEHVSEAHEAVFAARGLDETTYKAVTAGSVIEALGGIGVVALSIIGLAGIIPEQMAAIAAIAFGVALAAEGAAVAARFTQLSRAADKLQEMELGDSVGSELLGGLAGGVLGILALIGIAPTTLTAVAAIVFGASILLGAGIASRMKSMTQPTGNHPVLSETLAAAVGAEVLVGVAAIILGILAVVGVTPMTLTLVALLSLGSAALIQGTALGGTLVAIFH